MNVLSLFDGMSCGQIALNRAGIKYDAYFASEVDKYAIKVAQANYPNTVQIGDVTQVDHERLPFGGIDLLMGGSPCQGFSFAGKQLNFNDPRSKLFFEFIRLRDALQPKYVLLENVRMSKSSQDIISAWLGFQPQAINSSTVSAQNRYRLYWFGKRVLREPKPTGNTYGYDAIPIPPMKDKGIVLQDILEEDGIANEAMTNKEGKSHCITARYNGAVWWNSIQRRQRTMVQVGEADNIKGFDSIKRIYSPNGKAPTLTTMQGGHREPKVAIGRVVNRRLDEHGVRKDGQLDLPFTKQLEVSDTGKSNCLTTFTKDNVLVNGMQWRKLTPLECERLQTVPDNYTNHVSNSQRYKMLGNGWTVDVISHIMKGLK
jgi:DNA-cytosine methyltransferase